MAEYIPTNRKLRTTVIRALTTLQSRAMPRAQRQNKRRRRTDPAWQKVARAKKISAGAVDSAAALDTVSWLFKHSGALCQRSTWSMRAKKLADSKLGLTRATIEKAELQRWREQLVEILLESKTPLAQQARLASNPLATIAASSSSMRASTLRKRIREWRKLRAFSMGLDGSPWPRHVGVVLDYLQERIAEPHRSGRSVGPGAVLEALAFTEKKGGYGSGDRLADLQIVKNCVNQATHDLEVGAPPTRKAPLLPLMLVGALGLLVVDNSAPQNPCYGKGFRFLVLGRVPSGS